jgi:hypothetical protein
MSLSVIAKIEQPTADKRTRLEQWRHRRKNVVLMPPPGSVDLAVVNAALKELYGPEALRRLDYRTLRPPRRWR